MSDGSIISRLLRPFASKPQPCTSIVFCIDPRPASQDIRPNAYFIQFSIFNRTARLAADKIIKIFNVDVVTHFLPMQVVLNREIEIYQLRVGSLSRSARFQ